MPAGSPNFVAPADFAAEARRQAGSTEAWPSGDPHLNLAWFALLAETAMPSGARLALCPCGGERPSFLPLLRLPNSGQVQGLSNFYTPLFGLAGEAGADTGKLAELARSLARRAAGIAEIRLAPMDSDSASWRYLSQTFQQAGWLLGDYFCFGNWYHPVEAGGYSAYLASRPARLRNTIHRHQRKLATVDGVELRIFQGGEPDLATAISDFVAVYEQSWKEPEPFPAFIPGLCRWAAERGSLRLGVLRIAGKAVAAQLWLVANSTAYIVKLAYDPAFAAYSPGTVLSAALFEHVIDVDRARTLDYLIGDDSYKQDWMTRRRERRGLVAFNWRHWRGALGALRHVAGRLRSRGRRS